MLVALTGYLTASVALALLVHIASKEKRGRTDSALVFSYPATLIRSLLVSIPVPAVVGAFIYTTFQEKPRGLHEFLFWAIWVTATGALSLMYFKCRKYKIVATLDAIEIHGSWRRAVVPFHEISKVVVVHDSRSRGSMQLVSRTGATLALVSGSITDFEELVAVVARQSARGTVFREKDIWGAWTERRL